MSSPDPSDKSSKRDQVSADTAGARASRFMARVRIFEFRNAWWLLLDLLEERRAVRRALYAAGAVVSLGVVTTVWVYPWWHQRTAIGMARQWLDANRLDHASASIQEALKIAPERSESWKLAADLARRLGNRANALTYSQEAARLTPGNTELALAWASDALLTEQPEETERALTTLSAAMIEQSSQAQRIVGELARRRRDFPAARVHFENALRLDGPDTAINEVPLGIVLLNAREDTLRRQGVALLTKWTTNPEWGANALRTLLQDAIGRDDRPAMLTLAESLRAHPRCTLGDLPNCLLALSKTDEARFAEVLVTMEKDHAGDAGNIALLVSWLNQIGRAREASNWIKTLPSALTQRAPAAVGAAESLRQLADWPALLAWTRDADWGRDLEPLRLAYELQAAREVADAGRLARELWSTLQNRAGSDGAGTLFTANTLYAWGLKDEALALIWIATEQPGVAVQALGILARHYQVEKDATGQYRVFKRLHSLRPTDAAITNNYAFFATLTGNDLRQASEVAVENFKANPGDLAYRATYGLVLCTQNRADTALSLLKTVAADWRNKPVIVLSYGLALAGNLQLDEARVVLSSLQPDALTKEEVSLIQQALK